MALGIFVCLIFTNDIYGNIKTALRAPICKLTTHNSQTLHFRYSEAVVNKLSGNTMDFNNHSVEILTCFPNTMLCVLHKNSKIRGRFT